jgi:hypothetical protein
VKRIFVQVDWLPKRRVPLCILKQPCPICGEADEMTPDPMARHPHLLVCQRPACVYVRTRAASDAVVARQLEDEMKRSA